MKNSKFIPPYQALTLTSPYVFIKNRSEIPAIIDTIEEGLSVAIMFASYKAPVKLVVLQESVLQGFPDEVYDMSAEAYNKDIAIKIDGPEIKRLGDIAKKFGIFLVAGARILRPDFPEMSFNEAILFNPQGDVILRQCKNSGLYPSEHIPAPHDVFDKWVDAYGDSLDSFFPVADTEIGKIGLCLAMEGSYPEYIRGVAMNGAEVLCRMCLPNPFDDAFMIQNRAHALNNTMYVVGSQCGIGTINQGDFPAAMANGNSHIIGFDGSIISEKRDPGLSYCAGLIDVETLREFRLSSKVSNWIKDLRTEIIRKIYEKEILPPNMYSNGIPYNTPAYTKNVLKKQVELMIERGVYTPPSTSGWEERIVGANIKD